MDGSRLLCLTAILVGVAGPALAQAQPPTIAPIPGSVCKHYGPLNDVPSSFQQRVCYFGGQLMAPPMLLHAAASAAFGQIANTPKLPADGMDEFGRRFAIFYARHSAQKTAELLSGYLSHEDPRPHVSKQDGFWNRTRTALLGVLLTRNQAGEEHVALAPIAGAFASGFVAMGCYRTHNSTADAFRHTGASYGGYFATALVHEFHPDLASLASRILHKNRHN